MNVYLFKLEGDTLRSLDLQTKQLVHLASSPLINKIFTGLNIFSHHSNLFLASPSFALFPFDLLGPWPLSYIALF